MQKCTSRFGYSIRRNSKSEWIFVYGIEQEPRRTDLTRVLVLTEKPSAAKKIAEALDEKGKPELNTRGKNKHYLCKSGDDELIVANALGHLYELKQTEKGWTYPRLDTKWVPKYEVKKKATGIKPIISLIRKLAEEAEEFIVATDYDIEGSLIGYLTLKHACKADPTAAKRMRFSSLTRDELRNSYHNLVELDFPMIDAGLVRHEVDWLYGINLTRALTLSIKNTEGWFKIISTGRVQGPVLSFVMDRERAISVFVPVPYWTIRAKGIYKGQDYDLEYHKRRIDEESEAQLIERELDGSSGSVEKVEERQSVQPPHPPFSLSSLQYEAFRQFGFKPSRTLAIAQKLYLEALISYPRTSSEQLPESLDFRKILRALAENKTYKKTAEQLLGLDKLEPVQGKKIDPAHPAIHPTGEKPGKITPSEKKLYDLIVKRFLSLFAHSAVKKHSKVTLRSGNHLLFLRGLEVIEKGWMSIYDSYVRLEEKALPEIQKGDSVSLADVAAERKQTQPPARYNPSSLLKVLEKEGLGTKSTRSGIVDSLRSRGYVMNDRFEVTTLGFAVFETLKEYVPDLLSPDFTRSIESEMDGIQREVAEKDDVIAGARQRLLSLLQDFQESEGEIGKALVDGLRRYWRSKEDLGPCPKCGDGTLRIIRSAKTGKRFVGCTSYAQGKCDQTFPLPQKGSITPLDDVCPDCGHRLIRVRSGRRPWTTCINWVDCPGRQENLRKRKSQQEGKK
ncbi:DNA topoisomerase I [Candidatus Thorarchaeota archaeon]|nr:MAG: DNA topoisomerase I [Candidatus Thorarchaeota archaeon]